MSPINLDDLVKLHPESGRALNRIATWLSRQKVSHIYPSQLARDVRDINEIELATALMLLVSDGQFRIVYKVLTPSGVLTDAEFEDPRTIPSKLPDRWEHYFNTADADVVPIYKKVAR